MSDKLEEAFAVIIIGLLGTYLLINHHSTAGGWCIAIALIKLLDM
jgi:hypothetical protein